MSQVAHIAAAHESESNQPLLVQGLGPMFHAGFTHLPKVRDYREALSYEKAKME